jgi:hypothetical protein
MKSDFKLSERSRAPAPGSARSRATRTRPGPGPGPGAARGGLRGLRPGGEVRGGGPGLPAPRSREEPMAWPSPHAAVADEDLGDVVVADEVIADAGTAGNGATESLVPRGLSRRRKFRDQQYSRINCIHSSTVFTHCVGEASLGAAESAVIRRARRAPAAPSMPSRLSGGGLGAAGRCSRARARAAPMPGSDGTYRRRASEGSVSTRPAHNNRLPLRPGRPDRRLRRRRPRPWGPRRRRPQVGCLGVAKWGVDWRWPNRPQPGADCDRRAWMRGGGGG